MAKWICCDVKHHSGLFLDHSQPLYPSSSFGSFLISSSRMFKEHTQRIGGWYLVLWQVLSCKKTTTISLWNFKFVFVFYQACKSGSSSFVSKLHFLLPIWKFFRVSSSALSENLGYPHLQAKIVSHLFYSDLDKRDDNNENKQTHFYSGNYFLVVVLLPCKSLI